MTLPKKKTRNITVNGIKYRWMVGAITYQGGMGYANVVVEDPQGKVMKYREKLLNYDRNEEGYVGVPVTPAMVREFILSRV